jgi:hypothetical protein
VSPRGVQASRYGSPGGFDLFGPIPRDIKILVAVQFVTFLLRLSAVTSVVPRLLELSPLVLRGFVWQLATYAFIGYSSSILIILELLGVLLMAPQVYYGLGRRHFWRMMIGGAVVSAVVAVLFFYFTAQMAGWSSPVPFSLMQGQRVILIMLVAAFAFANPEAQIRLYFVIPIKARWILPLIFAVTFIYFLQSKDVGGFVGLCTATAFTYVYRQSGGGKSWRWGRRDLREMRLRLERWWIGKKLDRMKKKRGFRVIPGDREGPRESGKPGDVKKGPWVH